MNRIVTVAVALVISAAMLTGCASKPEVSAEAGETLQESVQQVASLAAAGDPTAALAELDALQGELESAVGDGEVSKERSTSIQTSIDLVRADLTTAVAEAAALAAAQAQAAAEAQAAIDAQAAADARAAADAQAAADAAARAAADAQKAKDEKGPKVEPKKPGKG